MNYITTPNNITSSNGNNLEIPKLLFQRIKFQPSSYKKYYAYLFLDFYNIKIFIFRFNLTSISFIQF